MATLLRHSNRWDLPQITSPSPSVIPNPQLFRGEGPAFLLFCFSAFPLVIPSEARNLLISLFSCHRACPELNRGDGSIPSLSSAPNGGTTV